MKKSFYIALACLAAGFLAFSIAGKLAAIHVALIGGAILCAWVAKAAHDSGAIIGGSSSNPKIVDSKGKVSYTKIPHAWAAAILIVVEIVFAFTSRL